MFWSYMFLGVVAFVGGAIAMYYFLTSHLMEDEKSELKWRIVMGCTSEDAQDIYDFFKKVESGEIEITDDSDEPAPSTEDKDIDGNED